MKSKLILFLMSMSLFATSCGEEEPCDVIMCLNNGICNDGKCECPPGFEGDLCELLTFEKISGNFDVVSNCTEGSSLTDLWGIGKSTAGDNKILINNFHLPAINILATITDPKTFEIDHDFIEESVFYSVLGTGTIVEEGQLFVEYSLISSISTDTIVCSVNAIRM